MNIWKERLSSLPFLAAVGMLSAYVCRCCGFPVVQMDWQDVLRCAFLIAVYWLGVTGFALCSHCFVEEMSAVRLMDYALFKSSVLLVTMSLPLPRAAACLTAVCGFAMKEYADTSADRNVLIGISVFALGMFSGVLLMNHLGRQMLVIPMIILMVYPALNALAQSDEPAFWTD